MMKQMINQHVLRASFTIQSFHLSVCPSVSPYMSQYAEGLLISSSSSGGVGGLITRHLPFLFFQISFIFRFFNKENSIFPFYNSPASSSFRFCRPVYRCSLTYWLISSIKQTMSSLHNRDWPNKLNYTFKWVTS